MKILLRAALAIFSLGIGSAYAGDGNSATTLFTSIPSKQATPTPRVAAQIPAVAAQNGGAAVQVLMPAHRARARGCSGCFRCHRLAKA
jgi:hypothetical protein